MIKYPSPASGDQFARSMFTIVILALLPLTVFALPDSTAYWIRLPDSIYVAELIGKADTRTDGITIPGAWNRNQHAHEFYVKVTGSYDLYSDSSGGSNLVIDTDWSKTLGKFIPAPDITAFMSQLDSMNRVVSIHLGNVADSSGQGMIAPGTAGETLVKGDWLYVSAGGKYKKGNATNASKMPIVAICLSNAPEDSSIDVLWDGVFRRDSDTFSNPGVTLFMGLTSGMPTETEPSTSGNISQPCAVTLTTHIVRFKPGEKRTIQ